MGKQIQNLYTEIGIGNPTFISTEIEFSDGTEKRVRGFRKMEIHGVYIRVWGGRCVTVISSKNGIKKKLKDKKRLKILIGIEGGALQDY